MTKATKVAKTLSGIYFHDLILSFFGLLHNLIVKLKIILSFLYFQQFLFIDNNHVTQKICECNSRFWWNAAKVTFAFLSEHR